MDDFLMNLEYPTYDFGTRLKGVMVKSQDAISNKIFRDLRTLLRSLPSDTEQWNASHDKKWDSFKKNVIKHHLGRFLWWKYGSELNDKKEPIERKVDHLRDAVFNTLGHHREAHKKLLHMGHIIRHLQAFIDEFPDPKAVRRSVA